MLLSDPHHIAWQITFWILAALIVIPFPFKMHGYFTGKDQSPKSVKIDESIFVALAWVGLIGFYGFINEQRYLSPTFWYVWLVTMTGMTLVGFWWSPKMEYAKEVLGAKNFVIAYIVSLIVYLPMLPAVYLYASTT